jgi:hypothetical protein
MAGRPRPSGRGKSGLQGEMAAGNARPGQPEGKRHREETARPARAARARVKRWGKSPPRRRQRRWHGKPRQEQGQIGVARGASPRVLPPERPGLAARARRRRRAQRNGRRRLRGRYKIRLIGCPRAFWRPRRIGFGAFTATKSVRKLRRLVFPCHDDSARRMDSAWEKTGIGRSGCPTRRAGGFR